MNNTTILCGRCTFNGSAERGIGASQPVGADAGRVQRAQPPHAKDRAPRPRVLPPPGRGDDPRSETGDPPAAFEPPGELDIFHERDGGVSPEVLEDAPADEDCPVAGRDPGRAG